jgi:hypothetical protein
MLLFFVHHPDLFLPNSSYVPHFFHTENVYLLAVITGVPAYLHACLMRIIKARRVHPINFHGRRKMSTTCPSAAHRVYDPL